MEARLRMNWASDVVISEDRILFGHLDKISSLWIGDRLSEIERMTIISFLKIGHSFDLYVYNHIDNVPLGTTIKDANEILPKSEIFCYDNGSPAAFANLFRYALLAKRKTWWVDMDVICLKQFVFDKEIVIGAQGGREAKDWLNNAVLKLTPGIANDLYEMAKAKGKKLSWGETGPYMITEYAKENVLDIYVVDRKTFYPVSWTSWKDIYKDKQNSEEILSGAYALHLWHEMSRKQKSLVVESCSIYQNMKRLFL